MNNIDIVEGIRILVSDIIAFLKVGVPLLVLYGIYCFVKGKVQKNISENIIYRRYFSAEGLFAGEDAYLIEEVTNRTFFPLRNLKIESYVRPELKLEGYPTQENEMQDFVSVFNLMPRTTIKRRHRFKCMERGCYELESAVVWFKKDKVSIDSKARFLVYPRQFTIEMQDSLEFYLQSTDNSPHPLIRDPFSFSGIRTYQHGDPFHSINFKATARQGYLCVNNTDFLTGKQLVLAINFQMQNNGGGHDVYKEYMELALSAAAYLLDVALVKGYRAGFAANCRMVNGDRQIIYPISGGDVHFEELLQEIAQIKLARGNSFESVLEKLIEQGITNTEFYVFTLYTDDGMDEKLKTIEYMGNVINYINIQDISEMGFFGEQYSDERK